MILRMCSTLACSLSLAACSVQIAGGAIGGGAARTHGYGGASSGGKVIITYTVCTAGGDVGTTTPPLGGVGAGTTTGSTGRVPPASDACGRTGVDPGPGDAFARLQYGFAATWRGTAHAPAAWVPESWDVWARFDADGGYSAHSLGTNAPALYYGSDDDVAGTTYMLDDLQASGLGWVTIQVYFFQHDWNTVDLKHIALSDDLSTLTFEFWKDGYGPVVYDLQCVP